MCQRTMTEASETESNEEERPIFCPYNRESLAASEARIAEEEAKKIELKKKREEGEVSAALVCSSFPCAEDRLRFGPPPADQSAADASDLYFWFSVGCESLRFTLWMEAHL